jgi:hypothetical protein
MKLVYDSLSLPEYRAVRNAHDPDFYPRSNGRGGELSGFCFSHCGDLCTKKIPPMWLFHWYGTSKMGLFIYRALVTFMVCVLLMKGWSWSASWRWSLESEYLKYIRFRFGRGNESKIKPGRRRCSGVRIGQHSSTDVNMKINKVSSPPYECVTHFMILFELIGIHYSLICILKLLKSE